MTVFRHNSASRTVTPLAAVLAVTFIASFTTGVFWNAISFIAKHGYDFSQERNLVLYAVMGFVYTLGAANAGRVTGLLGRWASPRSLLFLAMGAQVGLCLLPVWLRSEILLWAVCIGVQAITSVMWPIVESYLVAGRHGPAMRSAIGMFNLTWMSAVALPLFPMAPLIEHHARMVFLGLAAANVLGLLPILWFAARPREHEAHLAAAHVPPGYRQLLKSARVLLPLSYILNAALSPVLPYRFEAIGTEIVRQTPITALWMIARVVAMVVMWRLAFWHGRWGTLLMAGLTMAGGFGLVLLAPSLPLLMLGLAVFGVGMGMVYYAALYYGMAVGRAEVEAGGTHEALIGLGYTIGPLAGLLGATIGGGPAIVGIVWTLIGGGSIGALLPYLRARRLRQAAPPASPPPAANNEEDEDLLRPPDPPPKESP